MPAEALAAVGAAVGQAMPEGERARRQALRIAFAVAGGMVATVASGSPLPFLAPLFAAQFLVASRSPPKPAQAIGMVVLIAGVGQSLAVLVALLGERPVVLAPALWLLYFACFLAQARGGKGGQAATLVLVVGVMVPLMETLRLDLGASMAGILAAGVAVGALLAWAAHAAFPDPGGVGEAAPQAPAAALSGLPRPVASASILLAVVVLCLVDSRLSSAVVIPVTVATVLGQLDLATSRRAALGLVVVNVLGGVAASLVFTVVDARPTLLGLFLAVLLAGLLFGAGAAADRESGKVHAGGLTIFLILLGLGVSPLPTTTPESFSTRITYVSLAVLYALWACVLLWPTRSAKS